MAAARGVHSAVARVYPKDVPRAASWENHEGIRKALQWAVCLAAQTVVYWADWKAAMMADCSVISRADSRAALTAVR